ncbi:MAG: hypothetical protein Q4E33_02585 [Erysipelotrichaceae bacterium]|nr:hypothetical protein [Erysipelotrichaceae bacterium]
MYRVVDEDKYYDCISQLFSMALFHRIHLVTITDTIAKSDLIEDIEKDKYDIILNNSTKDIFIHLFPSAFILDEYKTKFDEGYWCGYVYMNLFYHFKKPFSYLFLKLPLTKLLDMYEVFHQMDISQMYIEFERIEKENTIMELLLIKNKMSITRLSKISKVPIRTISYYKKSDYNLYKGSYENIRRIAIALEVSNNLFINSVPIINYEY